jgi:DNA-binding NtrC family response regulator
MNPRVLIVDAERELRVWLRHHVEILWPDGTALEMEPAELEKAHARHSSARNLDLILLGVNCGGDEDLPSAGLEPLRRVLRFEEMPPVVVIAGGGNELTAAHAMRLGAADYLPRRLLNAQRLATSLRLALRKRQRALTLARTPRRAADALQLARRGVSGPQRRAWPLRCTEDHQGRRGCQLRGCARIRARVRRHLRDPSPLGRGDL